MSYFILLKRKNAKKWAGAIPARKGVSRLDLESLVKKTLKKSYSAKIITSTDFNALLRKSRLKIVKPRVKKVSKKRKVNKKR